MKKILLLFSLVICSCSIKPEDIPGRTESGKIIFECIMYGINNIHYDLEFFQKIDLFLQAETQNEKDEIAFLLLYQNVINELENGMVKVYTTSPFSYQIIRKNTTSIVEKGAEWLVVKYYEGNVIDKYIIQAWEDKSWSIDKESIDNESIYHSYNYGLTDANLIFTQISNNKLSDQPINNYYSIENNGNTKGVVYSSSALNSILIAEYSINKPLISTTNLKYLDGGMNVDITSAGNNTQGYEAVENNFSFEFIPGDKVSISFDNITEVWPY